METIIRSARPRIRRAEFINPSDYAAIGTDAKPKPKVYVRTNKPNRMKAIMVAASFATFVAFFENGGYDAQGAKWCNEVWQISRFYQPNESPIRA